MALLAGGLQHEGLAAPVDALLGDELAAAVVLDRGSARHARARSGVSICLSISGRLSLYLSAYLSIYLIIHLSI